ncbi:putative DNA-binding protein [Azospirillaceae bacterium]
MSIRLNLPCVPHWLSLPHGVRVYVRPIDTATELAAREIAREQLQSTVNLPLLPGDAFALERAQRKGRAIEALAVASGQIAILAWEGVLSADGDVPEPPTLDSVRRIMAIPAIASAFINLYYQPLDRLKLEGEGCGVAPVGASGAALDIAGVAPETALKTAPVAM